MSKIRDREVSSAIYDALVDRLEGVGAFKTEVKKTSLHLVRERAFLGVHPRATGLLLNIVTSSPIKSDRIHKADQVSRNRCHNEVRIDDVDQIDDELVNWIGDAYRL